MKCDKSSADPAKHQGPFTVLEQGERYTAKRCEACGNVALDPYPVALWDALDLDNLPEILRPLRDDPDGTGST